MRTGTQTDNQSDRQTDQTFKREEPIVTYNANIVGIRIQLKTSKMQYCTYIVHYNKKCIKTEKNAALILSILL